MATREERLRENSSQRREKQKEELRAAILRAAGEEFAEFAYEGFSLRRVAERVGYSPTTIYLYFQNKDELLLETARSGFALFDATFEAIAPNLSPREKLRAFGEAYFRFGIENPALYRLMFLQRADFLLPRLTGAGSDADAVAALSQSEAAHHVRAQELLVAILREGAQNGEFSCADPLSHADALWASIHGLVSLCIGPLMSPEHGEKVVQTLLETLLRGLKC